MPYYRLYHLNPASGHIDLAEEFDAVDDVQAVAIAKERERRTPVELWQENRKVLRLEGAPNVSGPSDPSKLGNALPL